MNLLLLAPGARPHGAPSWRGRGRRFFGGVRAPKTAPGVACPHPPSYASVSNIKTYHFVKYNINKLFWNSLARPIKVSLNFTDKLMSPRDLMGVGKVGELPHPRDRWGQVHWDMGMSHVRDVQQAVTSTQQDASFKKFRRSQIQRPPTRISWYHIPRAGLIWRKEDFGKIG